MKGKTFKALIREAEKSEGYWTASVVLKFTEDLCQLMENKNISRVELANRLGVSPAYITKVLRGNINLTIDSMVRLARAVGAMAHIHVAPENQEIHWRGYVKGGKKVIPWGQEVKIKPSKTYIIYKEDDSGSETSIAA
jgi:transcriptional regulator with XRE-family HTH domain